MVLLKLWLIFNLLFIALLLEGAYRGGRDVGAVQRRSVFPGRNL
jgi:hypothetical protein